jgi:hypothetical protein
LKKQLWELRLIAIAASVLLLSFAVVRLTTAAAGPRAEVQTIWRNAQVAGGYSFRADVLQKVVPAASLSNVGRTSRTYQYHLEGKSDLKAHTLDLMLWDQGGSTLDAASAAQLKVENGIASMRRGQQPWQQIDNFSGSFAPEGDFLAFLSGTKNIVKAGEEARDSLRFRRYTFEMAATAMMRCSATKAMIRWRAARATTASTAARASICSTAAMATMYSPAISNLSSYAARPGHTCHLFDTFFWYTRARPH